MNIKQVEVELPRSAKGTKKGSMYLNNDLILAAENLPVSVGDKINGLEIDTIVGSTPKKMKDNVPFYLNKHAATLVTDANPNPRKYMGRATETGVIVWRKA